METTGLFIHDKIPQAFYDVFNEFMFGRDLKIYNKLISIASFFVRSRLKSKSKPKKTAPTLTEKTIKGAGAKRKAKKAASGKPKEIK